MINIDTIQRECLTASSELLSSTPTVATALYQLGRTGYTWGCVTRGESAPTPQHPNTRLVPFASEPWVSVEATEGPTGGWHGLYTCKMERMISAAYASLYAPTVMRFHSCRPEISSSSSRQFGTHTAASRERAGSSSFQRARVGERQAGCSAFGHTRPFE